MKNTFVKVLSLLMALMMAVGVFSTISFAAECDHTKGTLIETVKPTCQDLGYSRYTCGICAEEWVTDVIYPSAEYHEVIEYKATAASCLAPAYTAGAKCKYCDYTPTGVEAPASVENSQLAHQFVGSKVDATCTADAVFVYTCKLCTKTAEEIKALVDEEKTQWVGQSYEQYAFKPLDGEENEAKGHNYKWTVVYAPSNTAGACTDGLTRGVCLNCGDVKESPIPVTHDYSINLNPNGVTCGEYKSGFQCKYCGDLKDAVKNDADKVGVHTVGYTVPVGTKFDVEKLPVKIPATDETPAVYFTIKELEGLGYKIGDVISYDATCKAAGSLLVVCSCGQVTPKPVAVKAHSFTVYGDIIWPTDCTKPAVRESVCDYGCNTKDTKVVVEAACAAHTTKDTETKPTCTEIGYTVTTCTNKFIADGEEVTCGYNSGKHTYKDPNGHSWSDAQWVSGDCGSADYTKTCTVCKADYEETTGLTVAEPDANKAHKYGAEVTVPATCAAPSYKSKVCSICGDEVQTPIKDAKPDPSVHTYPTGKDLLTEKEGVVEFVIDKAPTCAQAGQAIVWCVDCGEGMKQVTTGTLDHTTATTTENCYKITASGKWTLYYKDLAAKCNAYGYKADGTYCSVCGYEVKAATRLDYDANNHGGSMSEVGDPVDATCQEGAYQMYNTSCHDLVKVYTDGNKKAPCDFTSNDEKSLVPFKDPTCTEAGNHQYRKCQWCGTKQTLSTVATGCTYAKCTADSHALLSVTDNHVIPAFGHDWKEVKEQAETCTDTGLKAHEECATCKIVRFNNVEYKNNEDAKFLAAAQIGKHGIVYQFTITAEQAAKNQPSCIATGLEAGVWCTKCHKESDWTLPKTNHTLDYDNAIEVDCEYNAVTGVITPDFCNVESAVILSCSHPGCTYKTAIYKAAAKTDHKLGDYVVENLTGDQKSCTFAVMQHKECQNGCKYKTPSEVKTAATGCYTTKGVAGGEKFPLTYNCNTIQNCLGWSCDVCGEEVTVVNGEYVFKNSADNSVNPNKHEIVHRPVKESAPDTCTTAGFEIEYCGDCNYTDEITVNYYEKKTNHIDEIKGHYLDRNPNGEANVLVVEKVADSFIKYICPTCNVEVVKSLVEAPELTATYTVSAEKVAAGETFTVTYALSGVASEFSAMNLDVKYDASKLTFVGVKAAALNGLYAAAAVKTVTTDAVTEDFVGVSLVVANAPDGTAQKVTTTAEGTVLFTLTFVANKTASGNAAVAGKTVAINAVGNLNGDAAGVTAEDAQAIFAKVGTNDVAADVNLDGIVNLADVIALAKFAASAQTAADYLEMVGELDKLEAEVFALLEAGKLNDVNKDTIVNISDAYALIERVTDELDNPFTKLGNKVTMKAVVAYLNVNAKLVVTLA